MSEDAEHSKLSPSGAEKWVTCPGSLAMEEDYPDESSSFADEDTAAHTLASWVLEGKHPSTRAFLGRRIDVSPSYTHEVDEDMCDEVQKYVDHVRQLEASGLTLLVEQKVNYADSIGVEKDLAWGTSDCVLVGGGRLVVGDLKYGKGVKVFAEKNKQMMAYALGVLEMLGPFEAIEKVTLFIHQPRLNHVDPWHCTLADLKAFAAEAATAAIDVAAAHRAKATGTVKLEAFLHPSDKGCKWCRAKGSCPALAGFVKDKIGMEFEDISGEEPEQITAPIARMGDNSLPAAMAAIGLIEDWCKAIRAEVERRLMRGEKVAGYKLVPGKRGNRQWSDEKAAEKLLKDSFRLPVDDIYDKSLISAPNAVKLLKDNPKRLEKVQALIVQKEGKVSVAPEDDPRPAWQPMQFDEVKEQEVDFA